MIISPGTKSIFIHIQKTGGSSIEAALRKSDKKITSNLYDGRRHIKAKEFRSFVKPQDWEQYHKFAFVRNPWDRLVSWYNMCIQRPQGDFTKYIKENAPTFSDFITKTTTGIAEKTTWNQYDFLIDDEGKMLVDFVGRYENLQDDFKTLAQKINLKIELPHENKTHHKNYRDYYTDETRAIIQERFKRDIEAFGYEF